MVSGLGLIWVNAEEIRAGSEELCSLITAFSDFISLHDSVADPEWVKGVPLNAPPHF